MTQRRLVKIKLLGELGKKFGRYYEIMALNPKEIISALSNQLDGFKEYLATAHENGVFFKLVNDEAEGMGYEGCFLPCDQLIMAPVITGSGGSGGSIGKILLGAALIGLAFIPGIGTVAATATAKASLSTIGSLMFSLGGALVFGGIAELLTPSVKEPKEGEQSFLFDRAAELTTQGLPVPLLYGEFLAAAPLIISSSISTEGVPA
jgi:predicted phage tail protein